MREKEEGGDGRLREPGKVGRGMDGGETNIMLGNARKLALASFNIRFILFHRPWPVGSAVRRRGSEFLSSSGSLLAYRFTKDLARCKRRDGRDEGTAANFLSRDYFPRAGN